MISILCIDKNSNYKKLQDTDLDLWDKDRDMNNYNGQNKIIAHPPCQQWSQLKAFAKPIKEEKDLAIKCWELVNKNGGILEHPRGSYLFKYVNADYNKIISVDQHYWGFPARKRTLLYYHNVEMLPHPLNFNAIQKTVDQLHSSMRSRMTIEFCLYLINSIKQST